jgi:hypothetical protein
MQQLQQRFKNTDKKFNQFENATIRVKPWGRTATHFHLYSCEIHRKQQPQGREAPLFSLYVTGKQVYTNDRNMLPWKGQLLVLVCTSWSPI